VPRLTPVHWSKLICVFAQFGFVKVRKKGSHHQMVKDGVSRPITIPEYKEVGLDIIKNCIKTAGITKEQYFAALAKC